jgi:hypothetical protein
LEDISPVWLDDEEKWILPNTLFVEFESQIDGDVSLKDGLLIGFFGIKKQGNDELKETKVKEESGTVLSKSRIIISHFVCYKKQVSAGAITSSSF